MSKNDKNIYKVYLEEPPKNVFEKIIDFFSPKRYIMLYTDSETYLKLKNYLEKNSRNNLKSLDELVEVLSG